MHDMLRACGKSQDHIVVLAAVKLGSEKFSTIQQIPGEYAEMTYVIVCSEIIYSIIRLESEA
jgi:hypothetical protein